MLDKSFYVPYGLEPIETASRDEIAALQTARLTWSLKHAYDNVPAYRRKFASIGSSCSCVVEVICRIRPSDDSRPITESVCRRCF